MPSQQIRGCIIGLGLMGGSFGLAWRAAGHDPVVHLTGVDRNPDALESALQRRCIDAGTTDLAAAVSSADIVVLATPVRTILRLLPEVGRHARPGALILDLGSTKTEITTAMAGLPAHLQAVGGHPMCGKERAGVDAAEAGLFRNHPFVLCPTPGTAPETLARAEHLVRQIGARPVHLAPDVHDRVVAGISHLPYLIASNLVCTAEDAQEPLTWLLAASGFRDTTRLAASDVDMMADTLLTNRGAVLAWVDAFAGELAGLRAALAAGDEESLRGRLSAARARRTSLHFE